MKSVDRNRDPHTLVRSIVHACTGCATEVYTLATPAPVVDVETIKDCFLFFHTTREAREAETIIFKKNFYRILIVLKKIKKKFLNVILLLNVF